MKKFLYCEETEGGMEYFTFSHPDRNSNLFMLRAWMSNDTTSKDSALLHWLDTAEIGEYYIHRLGIVIRVKE